MKTQIKNNGFTLVESLVAIIILLIGILGPLGLATRGITDGFYAQNQLIGTYLAQEGLEIFSNVIDNNKVGGDANDFLTGLDLCISPATCQVVVNRNTSFVVEQCDKSAGGCKIVFDTDNEMYQLTDSVTNPSGPIFTRTLSIDYSPPPPGTNAEAFIISTVTWRNRSSDINDRVAKLTRYVNHSIRYN